MAKMKITGFARLLIFLIIFLPLSFFGASYINGEDPWQKIREFTGGQQQEQAHSAGQSKANQSSQPGMEEGMEEELKQQIRALERKLVIAEEKLARCQLEQAQNQ